MAIIPGYLPANPTEAETEAIVAAEMEQDENAYKYRPPRLSFRAGIFMAEGTEFAKPKLHCVVLFSRITRARWAGQDDKMPVCSSTGGQIGVTVDGEQRPCKGCFHDHWRKDAKGRRRKGCAEFRELVVLPVGETRPMRLRLPVTSIGEWDDYVGRLVNGKPKRAYFGVVTESTLTKHEDGTIVWHVAHFRVATNLPPVEVMKSIAAREEYRDLLPVAPTEAEPEEMGEAPVGEEPPVEEYEEAGR